MRSFPSTTRYATAHGTTAQSGRACESHRGDPYVTGGCHPEFRVLIFDDRIGIHNGVFSLLNAEWPRMFCTGGAGTPHKALMLGAFSNPT